MQNALQNSSVEDRRILENNIWGNVLKTGVERNWLRIVSTE